MNRVSVRVSIRNTVRLVLWLGLVFGKCIEWTEYSHRHRHDSQKLVKDGLENPGSPGITH